MGPPYITQHFCTGHLFSRENRPWRKYNEVCLHLHCATLTCGILPDDVSLLCPHNESSSLQQMACWLGCCPALPLCIVKDSVSAQWSSGELNRGSIHVVGHSTDSPSDQPTSYAVRCFLALAGLKEILAPESLYYSIHRITRINYLSFQIHGPSLKKWITDRSG